MGQKAKAIIYALFLKVTLTIFDIMCDGRLVPTYLRGKSWFCFESFQWMSFDFSLWTWANL